jgi:sporulenol synthase
LGINSDSNTINPDVDDTTAALRAMKHVTGTSASYREAWNRGLNWILSMQNKDGGWPAFENAAGLGMRHSFIRRGVGWLIDHQEQDGSWYGRWGVCCIYGTWAAITGLASIGFPLDHSAVRDGTRWLLSIQNTDGGWGESCNSDRVMQYTPLGASTPSQTAWALDALIAVHARPVPEIKKGIQRLISLLHEENGKTNILQERVFRGFFIPIVIAIGTFGRFCIS